MKPLEKVILEEENNPNILFRGNGREIFMPGHILDKVSASSKVTGDLQVELNTYFKLEKGQVVGVEYSEDPSKIIVAHPGGEYLEEGSFFWNSFFSPIKKLRTRTINPLTEEVDLNLARFYSDIFQSIFAQGPFSGKVTQVSVNGFNLSEKDLDSFFKDDQLITEFIEKLRDSTNIATTMWGDMFLSQLDHGVFGCTQDEMGIYVDELLQKKYYPKPVFVKGKEGEVNNINPNLSHIYGYVFPKTEDEMPPEGYGICYYLDRSDVFIKVDNLVNHSLTHGEGFFGLVKYDFSIHPHLYGSPPSKADLSIGFFTKLTGNLLPGDGHSHSPEKPYKGPWELVLFYENDWSRKPQFEALFEKFWEVGNGTRSQRLIAEPDYFATRPSVHADIRALAMTPFQMD